MHNQLILFVTSNNNNYYSTQFTELSPIFGKGEHHHMTLYVRPDYKEIKTIIIRLILGAGCSKYFAL